MAYQQQQNFRTEKWEILDQLALTENTRRRLVYSLKTPENSAQLFVDLGSYINDPNTETRVTGLCLQLPQFIDFVAGLDEVLNRVKEFVKKKPYSQTYGLEASAGGASATVGDGQPSSRTSLPRMCALMSIHDENGIKRAIL